MPGKAAVAGEANEISTQRSHRGSDGSTHGKEPTRNKGSLPGWWGGADQRQVREDRGRPGQMADGSVVPWRPGNAGGGKGPWFETSERSGESPTIDHGSSNVARNGSKAADLAAG